MAISIPSGKTFYLKKEPPYVLCLKPDITLENQTYIVKYDCNINGVTIIPRGTKIIGNWITQSTPSISAYFDVKLICQNNTLTSINAISRYYNDITQFNDIEVYNADYFLLVLNETSQSNLVRRGIQVNCREKILNDNNLNSTYITVPTNEIAVTVYENV